MKQMSTYSVKIRHSADIRKALSATADIYRKAVDFFIGVCMEEWLRVTSSNSLKEKKSIVEGLTVSTKDHPAVPYNFGRDFYKFPSYLRRAAIAEAIGNFAFEERITLPDTDASAMRVLAVDLGINNACTCSVMEADGTVTGRRFLKFPGENDRLTKALGRIKKAQRHGARRMPRLWARVKGVNDDIAVKTADFIVKTAVLYDVDVIVMEHLDVRGRKRGSKKQRLHHWRTMYTQSMVALKAHREGIRISTVCAWNTSRLAFDGTGRVKRGWESEKTVDNYSICEFSTGKIYNCDLSASYNIGARCFIRAITKSLPATVKQQLEAKVPSAVKRSTCTLSTLISLNAVLAAAAA